MPNAWGRLRRFGARLGLLVAGAIVGLLLAEVGARWYVSFVEAPVVGVEVRTYGSVLIGDVELGYVPRPGANMIVVSPEFAGTVRINSLGLRGPEIEAREPGERRIMFVGDSFTMATQASHEDTFVVRLRNSLASRLEGPVLVLNAGVDGYGTLRESRYAERLIPTVAPNVIVTIFFTGNDFVDNTRFELGSGKNDVMLSDGSLSGLIYARSLFLSWLLNHRVWTVRVRDPGLRNEYRQELGQFTTGHEMDRLLPDTLKALETFETMCAANRITCGVAFAPPAFAVHTHQFAPTLEAFSLEPVTADMDAPVRALTGHWPVDLPYLDLRPALLEAAKKERLYFLIDGHWNLAGHRVVAHALEDFVLDLLARSDSATAVKTAPH